MKYIAQEAVSRILTDPQYPYVPKIERAVLDIPAADVAPVVHGKWINGRCSVCGEFIPTDNARDCITEDEVRYCPNCGARMDEVGE